ncbi:MAG: hypothetical protein V1729_01265 [Candidatus Woesearchaeota archaeon]
MSKNVDAKIYFSIFNPVTEIKKPDTEQKETYIDGLTNMYNRGVQLVLPEYCGDRCLKDGQMTEDTPKPAFEDINSAIKSIAGTTEWRKYDVE